MKPAYLLLLAAGCLAYRPMEEGAPGATTDDSAGPTTRDETTEGAIPPESGLVYEVYVRSFQDSDGDGIGHLAGLTSRIPYLEGLGVTVLWLMPVFPSPAVSGYGVTDYLSVSADYGDTDAMTALTAAADAAGIRVVLDLPMNNSWMTHPAFVDAQSDPASPYRDRYVFADTQYDTERWFPDDGGDYYYGYFGSQQPDFDWTTQATHDDFTEVLRTWNTLGVGGWRVDAVRQLVEEDGVISDSPGCHDVMAWFVGEVHADDGFVISEAFFPDDVAGMLVYLGTAAAPEADVVIDAPRANVVVATIAEGDPAALRTLIDTEVAAGAARRVLSFYASHDTDRLPVRVSSAVKRRLVEVLNFTLPGLPMLYYGEELDLGNGDPQYRQDEPQRTPMPWDASPNGGFTAGTPWFNLSPGWEIANVATAAADPTSVYTLILALQDLRRRAVALREGTLTWEDVGDPAILAWTVQEGDQFVRVAANFGNDERELPALDGCRLTPDATLAPTGYAVWASADLCDLLLPGNP